MVDHTAELRLKKLERALGLIMMLARASLDRAAGHSRGSVPGGTQQTSQILGRGGASQRWMFLVFDRVL